MTEPRFFSCAHGVQGLSRIALLAVVLSLAAAGCLETTFSPAHVTDVAAVADAADAGDLDTIAPDASVPDTIEIDTSLPADVTQADVAAGEDAVDAGPVGLPLGATCATDGDCADALCISISADLAVCSKGCDGQCPIGFRCGLAPFAGSSTVHYCLPLPGDLCRSCEADADCAGGLCVTDLGGKAPLCGLFCDAGAGGAAACPAGFVCQSFLKGELCVPEHGTCTCSSEVGGQSWKCAVETPLGSCSGEQICVGGSWSLCTAASPGQEVCDGADNDCDGDTDEGFALTTAGATVPLGGACGIGACAGGKVVCGSGGKVVCSSDGLATSTEICGDSADNDCDGETDEGCPEADIDGDGSPDSKDCHPYQAESFPGAKEGCCLALPATATALPVLTTDKTAACDVNCDGKVLACDPSDADGDGFKTPADCDDSDATVFPGGKEKCGDNIDQDCSGKDLACSQVLDNDKDGWPAGIDCNDDAASINPAAIEHCNFVDDDCDGVVDDGNPGGYCANPSMKTKSACQQASSVWFPAGQACGPDKGACKPGTLVCSHVGLLAQVTCTDAQGPQPETCNGVDDDCNGTTDEAFPSLASPCDGPDADACKHGKFVCADDEKSVVCGAESQTDLLETCDPTDPTLGNGADEDCDGQTDELCFGADADGDGVAADKDCNDADSGVFPGAKEPACCDPALKTTPALAMQACDKNCDGKVTWCDPADKDFDGRTGGDDCDESDPKAYLGAIEKCGDGVDQDCDKKDLPCSQINDNDGDGFAAAIDCNDSNPNINPWAEELCNFKDDDCNGLVDDGNPGASTAACGSATGACKPGNQVCVRQKFKAVLLCVPVVGPQVERCNGIDDNCNGQTDEFFPTLGKACDGADSDQCKAGTGTCAADGKSVVCNNETVTDQIELCDGVDNDCDGKVDEQMVYFGKGIGEVCDGQGACGAGTVVCSPELQVAVCSTDLFGTAPAATLEICDGVDNDCDGLTDEGQTFQGKKLGMACLGNGACGKVAGLVECGAGGKAICSTMLGGTAYKGSAEVCNGVDDDCDGRVDEGLVTSDSDCKLAGLCTTTNVKAVCLGGKWACNYTGVVGYQGDKEVLCDGLDNDCDGKTDDEFAVDAPCDGTDTDLCANGKVVCADNKLFSECGTETKTDIVEACNAVDDDCDGKTDEDFPINQACDGDDSDKCANGKWTCAADGAKAECVNETKKDIVEQCNGADDDCNGKTDELFDVGKKCDGPDADLCENGLKVCTVDGKGTTCGKETVSDIVEVCDKVDNDCDGKTDEGQVYDDPKAKKKLALGVKCKGIGGCGFGTVVCSPTKKTATCSTNPDAFLIFDGKELCDGLDNDCNGLTDDNLTWKGLKKGQPCDGLGVCGKGTVECGTDKQVTCSTQPNGTTKPSGGKEVCDGKDNDCDGKTDNGLKLTDSDCKKVGVCAKGGTVALCTAAKWTCDYSKVVGFEAIEKTCDGLDNDCDGLTDEGFQVGKACDGDDSDQCKNGTWQCSKDGKSAVCSNEKLTDIPEVCDSADNDCDGFTDENFTYGDIKLGGTCDGVGACGAGTVMCGKVSKVAVCSTDPDGSGPQIKTEICDDVDNDCDGKTDNGMLYKGLPKGAPCSGIGECGLGKVECNPIDKKPVCSSNSDGTSSNAIFEQCDGKDNDCDGLTDEQIDPSTNSCNKLGVCAKALTPTCVTGKWSCAYAGSGYEAKESLCDGLDNDCNGVTDDPFPDKGKGCDGPDPDKCANGKLLCASSQTSLMCGKEVAVSTIELCDKVDNNCNGQTDEGFSKVGQVCDGPDSDKCANGKWTCSADGKSEVCGKEFPTNIKEVCDGKDNDCDGKTDEGFNVGAVCDGPDSDLCKFGKIVCAAGGKAVCGTESKLNVKEICNNLDDDCDGKTDEGFGDKGLKCDSSADIDACATGTWVCSSAGALVCSGDFECAINTTCASSGKSSEPDKCQCGSITCDAAQGDECATVTSTCTCNGGGVCKPGQVCVSGSGCKAQ